MEEVQQVITSVGYRRTLSERKVDYMMLVCKQVCSMAMKHGLWMQKMSIDWKEMQVIFSTECAASVHMYDKVQIYWKVEYRGIKYKHAKEKIVGLDM